VGYTSVMWVTQVFNKTSLACIIHARSDILFVSMLEGYASSYRFRFRQFCRSR